MYLPISVVIADDHVLYRQTLATCITASADLQLLGTAATGAGLVELVKQHHPDIALVDVRMPGMDGMETCRRLLQLQPGIGVIAITMHANEIYVQEMLKAGARGYLLKDAEAGHIIKTIKEVHRQGTGFDPHCTPVLTRFINGDHIGCKLNELQKQVMTLIGEGCSSEDIAARLNKGIDSVHLLRKKTVRNLPGRKSN